MDPLFASLAALALVSSGATEFSPTSLGDPPDTSVAAAALDANVEDLLRRYDDELSKGHFANALAIASKLQPDNPTGQAMVAGFRAAALIGLKRDTEATDEMAKAERLSPQTAEPLRLVLFAALLSNRTDVAEDMLDKLIARAPDIVRNLPVEWVGYLQRSERPSDRKRNEDRRIALAQLGYGGDTEDGNNIVTGAVDILVRRRDFSTAQGLLPYVREPRDVEDMLIDKRYAPLWPELEQRVGPHLENVRKAVAASAEESFARSPGDHYRLANLANALRHTGKLREAIALRSKLPQTRSAMSTADEHMGWAINNVALALHEAGQPEEADKLFASLNDAPMPKEFWRVSMKINRLELLVQDGKFEKALPLIEPTAKTEGSPYADQLTRRLRYCTLNRLGRQADAAKFAPELMAHAKDAPGPTIDGLLCAGEIDKAEAFALAMLKESDDEKRQNFERDFLRQLQAHQLTSDDPSVWQDRWRQLRQRPAIAAEFNRLGRDLPENLLPLRPTASQ